MGYDLTFLRTPDRGGLTEDDFEGYFSGRGNYRVARPQAVYENEETGVYFVFEIDEASADASADLGEGATRERSVSVSLRLNFVRPHVFALEAEPEIAAFVARFGLSVDDPQGDMADGVYSREAFLSGWSRGNRFAYGAVAARALAVPSLPTAEIERCWTWNRSCQALQEILSDVFVPRIMFVRHEGAVRSLVTWPDAIPIVLPRVDLLVLARDRLAPRNFLGMRRKGMALAPFSAVEAILADVPHERREWQGGAYTALASHPPSRALGDLFRSAPALDPGRIEGLGVDRILNEEILGEGRRGT